MTLNIEHVQSKRVEQVQISREDGTFAYVVKLNNGEDVVMTLEGDEVGYQGRVVHESGTESGNAVSLDFAPDPLFNGNSGAGQTFELPDVHFDTKS